MTISELKERLTYMYDMAKGYEEYEDSLTEAFDEISEILDKELMTQILANTSHQV